MSLYHSVRSRVLHSMLTLHVTISSSVSLYLCITLSMIPLSSLPQYQLITLSCAASSPHPMSLYNFIALSLTLSSAPSLSLCYCVQVWKHHNLRVAYVAQHSFHHVEQHLDSSPVDYMKWRFSGMHSREGRQ